MMRDNVLREKFVERNFAREKKIYDLISQFNQFVGACGLSHRVLTFNTSIPTKQVRRGLTDTLRQILARRH